MNPLFVKIIKDPSIIPGVHHFCDEWCDYCAVTARCLAFRCINEFRRDRGRAATEPTFVDLEEAANFTREIAAVEGIRFDQRDNVMAHPAGGSGADISDPLAALAWEYAVGASELMMPTSIELRQVASTSDRPAPDEIVMWYHLRIYMNVFRALIAMGQAEGAGSEEVAGSAKLVLVSVQRSRDALRLLRADNNGDEVDDLVGRLDELERGLDERFPKARDFVRVGIDCASRSGES